MLLPDKGITSNPYPKEDFVDVDLWHLIARIESQLSTQHVL